MSGRKRRFEKFGKSSEGSDNSSEDEGFSRLNSRADVIGPSLPPHLNRNQSDETKNEANRVIGPVLPAHLRSNQSEDCLQPDEKTIGPILPPHLIKPKSIDQESTVGPALPEQLQNQTVRNEQKPVIGPIMPPHLMKSQSASSNSPDVIGPALPSHLKNNQSVETRKKADNVIGPTINPEELDNPRDASMGPVLPPHLRENEAASAGPALPPHLLPKTAELPQREERILGPTLPPGFVPPADSDSEDDTYGPDPRLQHSGEISMENVVAARAERARRKMLGLDDKKVERETWMLELPPEKAAIVGLGARQFRAKLAPEMGDRSVWTDTPTDAAKKAGEPPKQDDSAIMQQAIIDQRDKEMEKLARKEAKRAKRDQSLIDLHAKKMKKQAKEEAKKMEGKPKERKMFSREEDMQVHRFDEAQKKAILKKAQLLDDRFSRGQSKFL